MKRRGFLGALGGAAVAGPSAIASASSKLAQGVVGASLPASGLLKNKKMGGMAMMDSMPTRYLDDIRRQLAGKWMPWEQEEKRQTRLYGKMEMIDVRFEALRSVSKVHGKFMAQRESRRLRDEVDNSTLLSRLLRCESEES